MPRDALHKTHPPAPNSPSRAVGWGVCACRIGLCGALRRHTAEGAISGPLLTLSGSVLVSSRPQVREGGRAGHGAWGLARAARHITRRCFSSKCHFDA